MNKVILIGRLTRDPELNFAAGSGTAVTRFSLAVTRPFKKDETDFINCIAFGKTGETIDTFGNQFSGFYSEAIYQNISQWFGENEVEYEKISTGLNMSHHIMSYIKGKRFIPVDKDEEKLFLEKNLKKQLYRRTLSKIYRLYCMHELRTKPTTMQNVMDEINSTPELLFLSDEQKIGLVKCFLRKEEKEKFKNQIQNSENKLEIPHEDSER